jgi:hypothetical protein
MTLAVGGGVKAYFKDHPGLTDFVSMHHKYVEYWVRVFYAKCTKLILGRTECSCFRDTRLLFSDTILLTNLD